MAISLTKARCMLSHSRERQKKMRKDILIYLAFYVYLAATLKTRDVSLVFSVAAKCP